MSYALETMFPKGSFSTTTLNNTPAVVGSANRAVYVAGGVVVGGVSARVIRFHSPGFGVTYFQILLAGRKVAPIPPFRAENGLAVSTTTTTADVGVTLSYVEI